MKTLTLAKIAALVVTITALFAFSACPTDGSGDPGGNYSNDTITVENGVSTLKLSGQVYTWSFNQNGNITYAPYTGSKDIPASYGGFGEITRGMFNYSIGVPENLEPFSETENEINIVGPYYIPDLTEPYWDNFQIQPANVNFYFLNSFYGDDTYPYSNWELFKMNLHMSDNRGQVEMVTYVYVDGNVTVSGKGKSITLIDVGHLTTTDLNLALKTGWNALYQKYFTTTPDIYGIATSSVSLGNPNFRWLLDEEED